jgi:hypothetical protein
LRSHRSAFSNPSLQLTDPAESGKALHLLNQGARQLPMPLPLAQGDFKLALVLTQHVERVRLQLEVPG